MGRSARRIHRLTQASGRTAFGIVLRPVSAMRSGQVLACSLSLLVAGVLLTHGFIGVYPGRPVFVALGGILGLSAVIGLTIDHVSVQASRQRPEHLLVEEVSRSRRFGHSLSLVAVHCPASSDHRLIGRMRGTDRAWRQRNDLFVMLSETDVLGAAQFAQRIAGLVPFGAIRSATFPDDALTVDGLLDALHRLTPSPLVAVDSESSAQPGRRDRIRLAGGRHSSRRAADG